MKKRTDVNSQCLCGLSGWIEDVLFLTRFTATIQPGAGPNSLLSGAFEPPRMTRLWGAVCVLSLLILSLGQVTLAAPSPEEFKGRRQAYVERTKSGISVIFNAPDEDLQVYSPNKDFFYLTGFSEPGAILILSPQNPLHKETLFMRPRDLAEEKWTGPKTDVSPETASRLGIERVLSRERFQSELMKLMEAEGKIYTVFPPGRKEEFLSVQNEVIPKLRQLFPFSEFLDAGPQIAHLRMKKSNSELELLRKAVEITIDGQRAAAGEIAAGRFEYQVQAALEYQFRRLGATGPAFPSIVGSGANSTILHYEKNSRKMDEDDLVVVDVGAEFDEYAADLTRTFPVSGKFSPRQLEIYTIVLEAQAAALREIRPGVSIAKSGPIHKAAYDYINTHGKDLKGQPLGQYYIHGTSHHLGLDVHDAVDENSPLLETGMVITVEPGVYIPEERLGVRIEDDVLVTQTGYEFLSKDLPRCAEEIEKLMVEKRRERLCP